jgi:hypothetical protein
MLLYGQRFPQTDQLPLPSQRRAEPRVATLFICKPVSTSLTHALKRDPEKACPGPDPGWKPVFGKKIMLKLDRIMV